MTKDFEKTKKEWEEQCKYLEQDPKMRLNLLIECDLKFIERCRDEKEN